MQASGRSSTLESELELRDITRSPSNSEGDGNPQFSDSRQEPGGRISRPGQRKAGSKRAQARSQSSLSRDRSSYISASFTLTQEIPQRNLCLP
jgi:hypothetical protein